MRQTDARKHLLTFPHRNIHMHIHIQRIRDASHRPDLNPMYSTYSTSKDFRNRGIYVMESRPQPSFAHPKTPTLVCNAAEEPSPSIPFHHPLINSQDRVNEPYLPAPHTPYCSSPHCEAHPAPHSLSALPLLHTPYPDHTTP